MPLRLVSTENDAVLELAPGTNVSLGRKPSLGISSRNVSRDHCTVTTGLSSERHELPVVFANKKVCIQRHGRAETLQAGQSSQLYPGDTIYLSQDGSTWKHGFKVSIPGAQLAHVQPGDVHQVHDQSGGEPPSSKRLRSVGQGRGDYSSLESPAPGVQADDADQQSASCTGIFCGLTFVFWTTNFMKPLMARAKQAGANVSHTLVNGVTTHVVASRDIDADQAAGKLEDLPLQSSTDYYKILYDGDKILRLPKGIHFVTPEFVSDCLAHNRLQPEKDYLVDILRMSITASDRQGYETQLSGEQMLPEAREVGIAHQHDSTAGRGACKEDRSARDIPDGDLFKNSRPEASDIVWAQWHKKGFVPARVAIGRRKSEKRDSGVALDSAKPPGVNATALGRTDQGTDDAKEHEHFSSRLANVSGNSVAHSTGGSAMNVEQPSTKVERGSCGVWDMSYDERAAEETVRKLALHWHRQEIRSHNEKHAAAHCGTEHSAAIGTTKTGNAETNDSPDPACCGLNSICAHNACSAKDFCIVKQLEEIQSNYRKGKDQFRIKAIQRAIKAVVDLNIALRTAEDCEQLDIGEKSIEKLKEIVNTGEFRRNQILAQDPHHRAVSLFMGVWGTGDATAERWYRDGCRSLDDVRARSDLSMQQRTGLKYYEDFRQRIPRLEVATMGAIVCDAVEEVLNCRTAPDADMLFCSILGSYRRGKPMTGDVDMLIAPPPSCGEMDCRQALHAICNCLTKRGLLLEDMASSAPVSRGDGAATFMGVARHAISPCTRRIDIKLYPRRVLPFAILHFTGSGAFSRALRYWARLAANVAQKHHSSANGFRLSDYALVPIQRKEPARRESVPHDAEAVDFGLAQVDLGPSLDCKSERDIFEALGLDYVPPHMRYFHNFE